ncbi:MAG: hypothetical protein ABEJ30_09930 [Halorientalis sp.]
MEPSVTLLGPLDAVVAPYIEWLLLALAVVNVGTRVLAHRRHVAQAADGGADAVSRFLPHEVANVLLVLAAFYYTTLHPHAGIVMSVLVLGVFVSDFFEFESRRVEARRDIGLERPKAGIAASGLVLLYAGYHTVFSLIKPFWTAIV